MVIFPRAELSDWASPTPPLLSLSISFSLTSLLSFSQKTKLFQLHLLFTWYLGHEATLPLLASRIYQLRPIPSIPDTFHPQPNIKMSVDALADSVAATTVTDKTETNGATPAQATDAAAASADEGRRLYIGNLAYATTEEELKQFFKDYTM